MHLTAIDVISLFFYCLTLVDRNPAVLAVLCITKDNGNTSELL